MTVVPTELPEALDSPAFRATLSTFLEYRRQLRKPLTKVGVSRLVSKCRHWGAWYASLLLRLAMDQGWRGPHEPDRPRTFMDTDGWTYKWRPGEGLVYYGLTPQPHPEESCAEPDT